MQSSEKLSEGYDEAASEAASSYRDYWSDFISGHPKMIKSNKDIEDIARSTDKCSKRMEGVVGDTWDQAGRDSSTEAKNFYYRLGSLNQLVGANEILAEAGLILQRRAEASTERGEYATHDQLLSGCLFEESALVSDGSFRASMLSRALAQYQGVLDQEKDDLIGVNAQHALRYSYDIQFLRVFDATKAGTYRLEQLRSMHKDLQIAYINDFLLYLNQLNQHEERIRQGLMRAKGQERDELRKKLDGTATHARRLCLEWFSVLAYRRFIDQASLHRDSFIRTALPREEEPWFHVTKKSNRGGTRNTHQVPKHGFNIIVTERGEGGSPRSRPIQLKVGGGTTECLPDIEKIVFSFEDGVGLSEVLGGAARAMGKDYANQPLQLSEQRTLEAALNPFHDRLAA
ncbi:MAG: hypothetical protein WD467_01910 [Candidatus Saccharimonadales bacterium]